MILSIYDLEPLQQQRIRSLYEVVKEKFPEIETEYEVWLNPENKAHILLNISVPFYDNERETEFSAFSAKMECEAHERTGVHISLMPSHIAVVGV